MKVLVFQLGPNVEVRKVGVGVRQEDEVRPQL
jgi:hypothetical protein